MTDGKHNTIWNALLLYHFVPIEVLGAILRIHAENDRFYISSDNDDRRGLSLNELIGRD